MNAKLIMLIGALFLTISGISAQNFILDDFENGLVSFTTEVHVNPEANKFEVTDNPNPSGINTSLKSWKFTRQEAGMDWAGFWCTLSQTINTNDYRYVHVKYYRTDTKSQLRLMVKVNGNQRDFLPMSNHAPSGINVWENLVFDLEAAGIPKGAVEAFGLQPDFSSTLTNGTITYVDDIMFCAMETGDDSFPSRIPSGLKAQNVGTTSLDLTWLAVKEAVSYDIYKDDVFLQNVTGTSLNVPELKEFSLYKFKIIAKNAGNESSQPGVTYVQTSESVEAHDARMAWWREARFGMFIHWGGYAAYAGRFQGINVKGQTVNYVADGGANGSYAEWIMFGAQIPRDTYKAKIASDFTADKYDPKEWVRMAKAAGMKYIIFTSKHHEGLAMFNTNIGWNVTQHSPAAKDLVKGLVDEARKAGLKIGFYYSQALDWNNPGGMGWMPQNNNGNGGEAPLSDITNYVDNLVIPHLNTLVNEYGIDVIWWDMGEHRYPELQYRTLKAIKDNPNAKNIIFNDRLEFKIDNGLSGDFNTPEQSIPDVPITGRADGRDWETCMTMNRNWGYASPDVDSQWKSTNDLVLKLIDIASKGGNFLLNIGPKADGTFPQESIDRLAAVGNWMSINNEAIYGTIANPIDKVMSWGKITRKIDENNNTTLYLHVTQWPENGQLSVPTLNSLPVSADILGNATAITTEKGANELIIKGLPTNRVSTAISTTIKLVFNGTPTLGENIVMPDVNNKLTLLPGDSKVSGGICIEGDPQNFGCWAATAEGEVSGVITWKMQINRAGNYAISSELGATDAGVLHLNIDSDPNNLNYSGTSGASYETQTLGTINLNEGVYDVEVTRTSTKNGWNYINLRSIILTYTGGAGINENKMKGVDVSGKDRILKVTGIQQGNMIQVFDITGRLIKQGYAQSQEENIPLKGSSIVIVKISDRKTGIQTVCKAVIE